ncbi:GGDEF domain-containing protein [Paenibacillus mendelii]|uniref:GGDEF domain-containing protein n=1 Tax=Paenibacillus mendelii TaxID=206163 RepID=A0ABV6JC20_9BACL|nr:GGDEF domain-containing protein [Paenibacillus mendelii]MCQ6562890.1 GGDEF domain-containing protein [Paenibacillus mendelii]
MIIMQELAGPTGQTFASACVLTILVLMLFMAIRLYKSYRRNQIYRLLMFVLPIIMAQQGIVVALASPGLSRYPYLHLTASLTGLISFIIINFVFMKLYTQPSSRLKGMPFLFMSLGAIAIAGAQIAFTPELMNTPVGEDGFRLLALDFYGLVINFAILLNLRGMEQRFHYSASLIIFFVYQLAKVADVYVFHGGVPMLAVLTHLLPVIYYTLMFLLLFEWVIERLLMTFQSSITDGLTSLYNRRHFNKKAEQLLREYKRVAIIFCDIDNFKKLNDTQGHHRADGVLKQVAEIIKEETAGIGAAGRYGGEELLGLVAAPGIKPETVAEQIRSRIERETMVTVSVGVSITLEGNSVEEVVKQADEAMYLSKTSGKNKVTLHPSLQRSRSRSDSGDKPKRKSSASS